MDEKILILEDDQPFAEMLAEALVGNGFQAEISLDPQEALGRVREGGFDLLVSDYLMPKLEGTTFIRQVREFNRSIPVLMISAHMGEVEMKQASEAGVSRVLRKPFEMEDLVGEIRKLLGAPVSGGGRRTGSETEANETDFPQPLRFLPPVTADSSDFLQKLWDGFKKGAPLFVTGNPGFETDLIAAELSVWGNPDGGTVSFDFDAADLLLQNVRQLLSQFAGKDRYSKVVIARNVDRLDRSQQLVLRQALDRSDSFLHQGGKLTLLFPIEEGRLSLAEMSMDEGLLELIFGNLVKIPPLNGRYRDLAHYLVRFTGDSSIKGLDAEATAFLLRYDWPGNYDQLREVCLRLAAKTVDAALGKEDVRAALEKRLDVPLEGSGDPALSQVLRDRQTEVLKSLSSSGRTAPAKVLREAGCVGVEPAADFPAGQELLFPELLHSQSSG